MESMSGSDGLFDASRIEIESIGVWFDRNGRRVGVGDRQPGGNVGVGRNDDFMAFADAIGAQDEMKRFKAVGDADAVFGVAVGGVFLFEGFDFLAENVPGRTHEAEIGFVELGLELFVGADEVEEGDGHERIAYCVSREGSLLILIVFLILI